MVSPFWALLLFAGASATCAAAAVGTILTGAAPGSWSLAPQARTAGRRLAWSVLAGFAVYPAAYGIIMGLVGRADVTTGLVLGALHACIAVALAAPRLNMPRALVAAAAHITYGVVIGFVYVLP